MKNIKNLKEHEMILERNLSHFKNRTINKAIFLDRDGVLIKDMHYLSDPEKVFLEKGVIQLMNYAYENHIPVLVVTNQSGISRLKFSWNDYFNVTNRMIKLLGTPSPLIAIYSNSHLDNLNNNWRKPNPGMILEASKKFKINLKQSIMIGDRLSDLKAGVNAGIGRVVHVLSGHGNYERPLVETCIENNDDICLNSNQSKISLLNDLSDFTGINF